MTSALTTSYVLAQHLHASTVVLDFEQAFSWPTGLLSTDADASPSPELLTEAIWTEAWNLCF